MVKSTQEIARDWRVEKPNKKTDICDRCDKSGVQVMRTPDGDGPFCKDCYNYMTEHHSYSFYER